VQVILICFETLVVVKFHCRDLDVEILKIFIFRLQSGSFNAFRLLIYKGSSYFHVFFILCDHLLCTFDEYITCSNDPHGAITTVKGFFDGQHENRRLALNRVAVSFLVNKVN
jgi:hypothetical protein